VGDVVHLMPRRKRIALIAHDNCKVEMLEWAQFNVKTLAAHELYATGTTCALLANELGVSVDRFFSGPLGGDQQVGAAIAEGRIDSLVFFWDPLEPQPHDVDVKALLRIAVVCNVPTACNRATADFILSSPLTGEEYHPRKQCLPWVSHGQPPTGSGDQHRLMRVAAVPVTTGLWRMLRAARTAALHSPGGRYPLCGSRVACTDERPAASAHHKFTAAPIWSDIASASGSRYADDELTRAQIEHRRVFAVLAYLGEFASWLALVRWRTAGHVRPWS
jgi:methylglyoxal synthase